MHAELAQKRCRVGRAGLSYRSSVANDVIRILSDLHYGDRASRIGTLGELRPLLDGVSRMLLNGDTIDTRPNPHPDVTARLRAEVREFFQREAPPTTFLTGNHDPDISSTHALELARGAVFVTHGDILYDDIVPWSRDAPFARGLIAAGRAELDPGERRDLAKLFTVHRRAAGEIPQRHQAERHGLKYALGYLGDTIWPPLRIVRVLRAWRQVPHRAAELVRRHGLGARFVVIGHVHRMGVWRPRGGPVLLNTGSFCPPSPAGCVDVTVERVVLRRVERRGAAFHAGASVAEFSLAETKPAATLTP